jgi:hypothetical protein
MFHHTWKVLVCAGIVGGALLGNQDILLSGCGEIPKRDPCPFPLGPVQTCFDYGQALCPTKVGTYKVYGYWETEPTQLNTQAVRALPVVCYYESSCRWDFENLVCVEEEFLQAFRLDTWVGQTCAGM